MAAEPESVVKANTILRPTDFRAVSVLGKGQQGEVLKVKNIKSENTYATKQFPIRFRNDDLFVGLRGEGLLEIGVTMTVQHPNIVFIYDFLMTSESAFIFMELADMDLSAYLRTPGLATLKKINIIFGIGRAINYLHRAGYIHCDVKSVNILMKGDTPLLADFGITILKEDKVNGGCQTYHYLSPETLHSHINFQKYGSSRLKAPIIPEFANVTDMVTLEKWQRNHEAGEIWSYGIVCLEVIYNKANISWSSNILKSDLAQKYKGKFDPYLTLIKILLEQSKDEPIQSTLLHIFGPLPNGEEDMKILEVVCSHLLVINQDQRVTSYSEFLNQSLFRDQGLTETDSDNFNRVIAKLPLISPSLSPVYTSMLQKMIEWMFKLYPVFAMAPIVIMDAVDFISQKYEIYAPSPDTIPIFSCAVMFLLEKLYGLRPHTLGDYSNAIGNLFTSRDLVKIVIFILTKEKGSLKFESLYRHLPSQQLVVKAMRIMRNFYAYNELGGPMGVTKHLLGEETTEELESRQPKTTKYIKI